MAGIAGIGEGREPGSVGTGYRYGCRGVVSGRESRRSAVAGLRPKAGFSEPGLEFFMARGAFWTIIVDDQPTAFRAPFREDLLPTLKQLSGSTEAVIEVVPAGTAVGDAQATRWMPASRRSRGAGWRPAEPQDPRDHYKVPRDVKRARWASQAAEGRGPWMSDKPLNADATPTRTNIDGKKRIIDRGPANEERGRRDARHPYRQTRGTVQRKPKGESTNGEQAEPKEGPARADGAIQRPRREASLETEGR